MTVCSRPSTALICRIRAAKARASASRVASPNGLNSSMLKLPVTCVRGPPNTGQGVLSPTIWARGKRSKSFFTQSGG